MTSDSDFDLLADDSVNGFTRLFIALKKDALEKILKMGQTYVVTKRRNDLQPRFVFWLTFCSLLKFRLRDIL